MQKVERFFAIPSHGLRETVESRESRGENFWRNGQKGRDKLVNLPSMPPASFDYVPL
jgi:hypothetical protein